MIMGMKYDDKEFCQRLKKEITRLEERAKVLQGNDKKVVQDMILTMNSYLHRLEGITGIECALEEQEKEEAISSIIAVLNEIENHLGDLEKVLSKMGPGFNFTIHDATSIVDRFFYNCQIAEERIKGADKQKFITKKQVDSLNEQLRKSVLKMIAISRQSDTLIQLLREKYGADVVT
jgi:archaellum component FlaC